MTLPPWPEAVYRRAAAHWRSCPTCTEAGGEEADRKALCPIGRLLTEQWERAERVWAETDYERPKLKEA